MTDLGGHRKMVDLWNMTMNSGDDIAGVVHAVGPDVVDFRPGDRVAGLHRAGTPWKFCRICGD